MFKKIKKVGMDKKNTIKGHIDTFDGFTVEGWAADKNSNRSISFIIKSGNSILGEATADIYREDLKQAQMNGGCHGFKVDLFLSNITRLNSLEFVDKQTKEIFQLVGTKLILDYCNNDIDDIDFLEKFKSIKLMDEDFYLRSFGKNLSPSQISFDPYKHFLKVGFDDEQELSRYSNIKYFQAALASKYNFKKFIEGYNDLEFSISPFFDSTFYKFQLEQKGLKCDREYFSHYLDDGYKLGLLPSAFFDPVLLKRARFPFGKAEVIDWVIQTYRDNNPQDCPPVSRFYDELFYEERYQVRSHGWLTGIEHYFRDGILNKYTTAHPHFFNEVYLNTVGHHTPLPGVVYLARYLQMPKPANMLTVGEAELSIIILNWNKSILTLQCVTTIMATMKRSEITYEVVIIDNGSEPQDYFNLVEALGGKCKIIRNAENKYYGEANNIGVEASIGRNVLFLNNDAFVTESTIKEMMPLIKEQTIGGVGAKLLFPNGILQEAGGKVSACGQVTQVGKGLEKHDGMYTEIREVDYCSAACLLMDKQFFLDIGGFDYLYEPAYFEDTDLCTKIKLYGKKMLLQPNAITYHVENLTSRDPALNFQFFENIKINRIKFVGRWHKFLEGIETQSQMMKKIGLNSFKYFDVSNSNKLNEKRAIVYSPYHLVPGGGERYIFTIAIALGKIGYQVYFSAPDNVSRTQLRNLGRDLSLDLDNIIPINWKLAQNIPNLKLQVTMGNEVLPPVPGIAENNIYHCQFPFDMNSELVVNNELYLKSYTLVLVNSQFTQQNYIKRLMLLQQVTKEVVIINPPCPLIGINEEQIKVKKPWVLNVGRFFTGGHQKKQHIAIQAFKQLLDSNPELIKLGAELHLAGSLSSNVAHKEYFDSLVKEAEGYPVEFHVNISNEDLSQLYVNSLVYWHFTGWGEDLEHNPEVFEHFGISIIEAISAGVIPVLPDFAGPAETLNSIGEPMNFMKLTEIVDATQQIILDRGSEAQKSRAFNISIKVNAFSEEHFIQGVKKTVQILENEK